MSSVIFSLFFTISIYFLCLVTFWWTVYRLKKIGLTLWLCGMEISLSSRVAVFLNPTRQSPRKTKNTCNSVPSVAHSVAMATNVANWHTQGEGKELFTHFDSISNWFKYDLQPKLSLSFSILFFISLRSVPREDLSLSLGFYNSESYPSLVKFTGERHVSCVTIGSTRSLKKFSIPKMADKLVVLTVLLVFSNFVPIFSDSVSDLEGK